MQVPGMVVQELDEDSVKVDLAVNLLPLMQLCHSDQERTKDPGCFRRAQRSSLAQNCLEGDQGRSLVAPGFDLLTHFGE
eukprot:745971-Hanusia_phi.AAC.3